MMPDWADEKARKWYRYHTDLERIEEQHVCLLRKRHSMLPKGAGPEIERRCARCDNKPYPCDVVKLARALGKLIAKIRRIEKSDGYKGVFTLAHIHGQGYRGEDYGVELGEGERTLEEVAGE